MRAIAVAVIALSSCTRAPPPGAAPADASVPAAAGSAQSVPIPHPPRAADSCAWTEDRAEVAEAVRVTLEAITATDLPAAGLSGCAPVLDAGVFTGCTARIDCSAGRTYLEVQPAPSDGAFVSLLVEVTPDWKAYARPSNARARWGTAPGVRAYGADAQHSYGPGSPRPPSEGLHTFHFHSDRDTPAPLRAIAGEIASEYGTTKLASLHCDPPLLPPHADTDVEVYFDTVSLALRASLQIRVDFVVGTDPLRAAGGIATPERFPIRR
jgi:hypothetical protein